MCGIVGFFGKRDTSLLNKMTDLISHRGPDQDFKYEKENINIGFRRLSINDLSTGDQPFYDSNKKIGVFCNGEIYNHKELRNELENKNYIFKTKSDCEVILHGYMEFGLEFLKKINGMFLILIWNDQEQKIYLIRDRLGIKPCYFSKHDGVFYFSSEIKPLLSNRSIEKSLNVSSIEFYLNNRYVPSSFNLIKEIKTLDQGSILEIKKGLENNFKYWSYDERKSKADVKADSLKNIIEKSVNLRMQADVKVGIFLSGGLDSSIIAALMARNSKNFDVFTHSYNKNLDESHYAEKLCGHLGLKNFNLINIEKKHIQNLERIVESMEFPIGNSDIIALDLLCGAAKRSKTKVILSGEGSDEIFGSYIHHEAINILKNFKSFFKALYLNKACAHSINLLPEFLLNLFFNYGNYSMTKDIKRNLSGFFSENSHFKSYQNLVALFNQEDKKRLLTNNFNQRSENTELFKFDDSSKNYLLKVLRFEIENWLPSYHLLKEDKISMSHSIEMRFPFLDHNIFEFTQTENPRFSFANGKKYLKNNFQEIVPDFIRKRKKGPILVPVMNSFGDKFKEMYRDILNENSVNNFGLFNFRYIEKLFTQFEDNKSFTLGNKIFSLLVLQIWLNKFYK